MNAFLPPIATFLDDLVHPTAVNDKETARRHRLFIGAHLAAGLVALAIIPLWLALIGPISLAATLAVAWLATPLATVALLCRTGKLQAAHLLSAAFMTGTIVWLAGVSGGAHSPLIVWLPVVPLIASLSGSTRIVAAAVGMVLVGIAGLFLLTGPGAAHANGLVDGAVMVLATIAVGSLSLRMDREARAIASSAMEGEDRYRLLADNTTDLITRHDALGKVEFASPAARALLRVAPATILGNGLFDRVHVADRPAYLGALRRSYENRTAATVEFRLRRDGPEPAGEVIDVEMRCRPAAAADGTVNAVVAVTRDVSERKAYERELREARETADRANQAKSHFLAHMSHELRTPLNAIIGFAGILKGQAAGFDALERQREYATLIHGAGEHLLHVVNGILDMSKIESGTVLLSPEPLAIPPLVDACCDLMAHQASEAGVKLNRAKADELPAIVADHSACRQMVINLLSNAIKFTEAGGSVTVGARVEGGMMEIYVRDTGIGIAEEDLARIGTPFVQADSSYRRRFQGTGLGLSMVKSLAEMHGGRLKIESRLGRGTVASIVLPLQMAPVEAPPVPGADVLQTLRPIEKERRLG